MIENNKCCDEESVTLGNDELVSECALENKANGGSSTFLGLLDTPNSYAGSAGKVPVVSSLEDKLEFVDLGTGNGTTLKIIKGGDAFGFNFYPSEQL